MNIVLGGTGLIGGAIVQALMSRGRSAGILSRTKPKEVNQQSNCIYFQGRPGDRDFKCALAGANNLFISTFMYQSENTFDLEKYFERFAFDLCGVYLDNIVLISSASVYVDGVEEGPVSELYPTAPNTGYGQFKLKEEQMIIDFLGKHAEQIFLIRPSSVFGMRHDNVFSRGLVGSLARAAIQSEIFVVDTSEEVIRDYIRADYLAEAILNLMDKSPGGTFNIGGDPVSLAELLTLSVNIFGDRLRIRKELKHPSKRSRFVLSSEKALWLLGSIQPVPSFNIIEDYFKQCVSVDGSV
jgi:nucleoside-diphosphate-sugar epimerase|tara:strand:- start:1962 stop:2852 length:891 start_codon:yes stop_codon:yes gene_type:complete